MEKKALLRKLNWFYTLELNQVRMYSNQSEGADDQHLARALKRFAEMEQGHVENIRELIEELGNTATIIGEAAGKISGSFAGQFTKFISPEKTLEFNISLEEKAISDYKKLAEEVDDPQIREILISNMLDEELHTAWMKDYMFR